MSTNDSSSAPKDFPGLLAKIASKLGKRLTLFLILVCLALGVAALCISLFGAPSSVQWLSGLRGFLPAVSATCFSGALPLIVRLVDLMQKENPSKPIGSKLPSDYDPIL